MNSSTHIPIETLADIAEKMGTAETSEAATAHIAACSTCSETLRRLQQLILMMKTDSTTDAPRDVLAAALNVFSAEKGSPLRRIVALLTFDSRNAGPAFGTRSLFQTSRQMLYSAEETDLDLRITMQNNECIVAGQVIGAGCAEGQVEISGVAGRSEATLNDVCEFRLPPLPAVKYSLTVRLQDLQIEIPELELKV